MQPKTSAPRAAQPRPVAPSARNPRRVISSASPQKPGGSSLGFLTLLLLVLGVGAFVFAMIRYDESAQQVLKRLMGFAKPTPAPTVAPLSTPAPEPVATAQPTVTPPPEPIASPSPPEPTATPPPPDGVAWLLVHRDYWPKEVSLLKEADFPVVINGKTFGVAKVLAGTRVELIEFSRETVGVVFRGGRTRLPVAATDLATRAETAMAQASTESKSPKVAATPSAVASTFPTSGSRIPTTISDRAPAIATLLKRRVTLTGAAELRITGLGDPIAGSVLNFASPAATLVFEGIRPSAVAANFLNRMWVNGLPAAVDANLRVVQYGAGTVVIPQGPDFAAMTVFNGKSFSGGSMPLQCYIKYDEASLGAVQSAVSSFRLKRGYMATIAQEENGTGVSKNYVAQDRDLEVKDLPAELDGHVRFVRVFPWRWVSKKGVAGGIWQNLNVGWYYNWGIGEKSSPDLEYVAIRQNGRGPSLEQDWKVKGINHLLGYNEPDHKDQANLSVDEAISSWPDLLGTGLRLGSPGVADDGLAWLYEFMEKADAAKLRVDFVAIHYYHAAPPGNPQAAAKGFYNFLKMVHDRTNRPLWVTEWNNGASWTNAGDPTESQQKKAIEAMIEMLDKTDFVERYAIFNWVEECRNLQRKDGSLTPAGEAYRDKVSPLSYQQAKP